MKYMENRWSKGIQKLVDVLFAGCMAVVLLFVAWVGLIVTTISSFKVPSGSMEPALLPGDNILVNKWVMGARIFDVRKALKGEQVDISRLPALGELKRNDVVVFNYPCPRKWRQIEMDVKLYYVKRCVALPGDTLRIVDGRYRVSGWLHDLGNVEAQDRLNRMVTEGLLPDSSGVVAAYPDRKTGWTVTEFGPLYLPRAGDRIRLDDRSVRLYRNVIEWEQGRKLTRTEWGDILLGDSLVHTYSFLKSYYFVAGDRATDSRDSRYWGLLPEEYIVGRAVRIWKSIDPLTGKTRWDRVWKKIE